MEVPKSEREIFEVPNDGFTKVTYHPTENFLLASSWDSSVSLYNTLTYSLVGKYCGNAAILDCALISSEVCVLGGLERHVTLHNFEKPESKVIGDHEDAVRCLRYFSKLGLIFSGSWDRTMRAWDPRAQTHWVSTSLLQGKVYAMAASEQQNCVILSTDKKDVLIYDVRNLNELLDKKDSPLKFQTRCIEVTPNGQGYAIGSIEGRVGIEYFNSAPEIQAKSYAFKCHRKEDLGSVIVYPVNSIAFHPKFGTFATGGSDSFVNIWDGENKKRLWKLRQYPSAISSLAFNSDGKQLAIACSYMYEEGDIPNQPPVKLYIKEIEDNDVVSKNKLRN